MKDSCEWVDFRVARRIVQQTHNWLMSDEEAGHWLVDRAASGTLRVDPQDDVMSELFEQHRAGHPGIASCYHIFLSDWSLADIKVALITEATEQTAQVKRKRGRPPNSPWPLIMAEVLKKYPDAGAMKQASLEKLLCETAQKHTGDQVPDDTARPYAKQIRDEAARRRGK